MLHSKSVNEIREEISPRKDIPGMIAQTKGRVHKGLTGSVEKKVYFTPQLIGKQRS